MPALPNSSLVGLALGVPPGRGEPGASLAAGPMDWRADAFLPGSGEGLGLTDGGRRLAIVCFAKV